jgi:hypothetical protein
LAPGSINVARFPACTSGELQHLTAEIKIYIGIGTTVEG